MSRNIKEIGKKLLGKSLNSFHRKTGLPQLERNNEMQDGILDGILSQVDDAYIEKTEQSNVIHLDGSGDGVVVLDSIEGNTLVNEINSEVLRNWTYSHNTYTGQYANTQEFGIDWSKEVQFNCWLQARNDSNPIFSTLKPNTDYTVWINILENNPTLDGVPVTNGVGGLQLWINGYQSVRQSLPINTTGWVSFNYRWTREDNSINYSIFGLSISGTNSDGTKTINGGKLRISKEVIVLEGVDKPLNSYFEGLQSSFEEKVNDDGKYEIEILSHKGRPNELKNSFKELQASPREYMFISITDIAKKYLGKRLVVSGKIKSIGKNGDVRVYSLGKYSVGFSTLFNCNTSNYINFVCEGRFTYESNGANGEACNLSFYGIYDSGIFPCAKDIKIEILDDNDNILATEWCPSYKDDEIHWKNHKNSNKIKLLLNEPLRSVGDIKDRLCVKDGKLVVERWLQENIVNGSEEWNKSDGMINSNTTDYAHFYSSNAITNHYNEQKCLSDKFIWEHSFNLKEHNWINNGGYNVCILKSKANTVEEFKNWLNNNNIKVISVLAEPFYEEVNNEYGEPIILEGYENGTLYMDSTIIPTTTVRYTPKMKSLNTLKKISNNNTLLSNDINDNIIPYMMEVDLMIMEKEMALPSQINNRKVEVLDMTSMQKRTQEMLERLIKGKTLTEQECKTRVTTYLNAGKITDEQAEELMLTISEVYA